jgi:hypothetical protein
MARIRERNTGSVVNVPDEKVEQIVGLGYYERVDEGRKAATASEPKKSSKTK